MCFQWAQNHYMLWSNKCRALCSFVSFCPRMSHVKTTLVPPADMRISIDLRVILMHVWTTRCWKIYTVLSRRKKCLLQSRKYSIELNGIVFIYWIYLLLHYVPHPPFYEFYLFTVFISLSHYLHLLLWCRSGLLCLEFWNELIIHCLDRELVSCLFLSCINMLECCYEV